MRPTAFEFAEHEPVLRRMLYRMIGPGPDVDDLLQDTFVSAMGALDRFRGASSLRTWLCRIAAHLASRHLARKRRMAAFIDATDETDVSTGDDVLERLVESRRELELLAARLRLLSPGTRDAFVSHVLDERSTVEVAHAMGTTSAAVASRVHQARRRLRRAAAAGS